MSTMNTNTSNTTTNIKTMRNNNNNNNSKRTTFSACLVTMFLFLSMISIYWNSFSFIISPSCDNDNNNNNDNENAFFLPLSTINNNHKNAIQTQSSLSFWNQKWQDSTILVTLSFGNATKTKLAERLIWSIRTNGEWYYNGNNNNNNNNGIGSGGRIVIITDNATHYQQSLSSIRLIPRYQQQQQQQNGNDNNDNNDDKEELSLLHGVEIIAAKQSDLYPMDDNNTDDLNNNSNNNVNGPRKLLEFKKDAMRFKRFKTLVLDYLSKSSLPTASSLEHVLYMDVDIVIARSIPNFLQDYHDQMIRRNIFLPTTTTTTSDNDDYTLHTTMVNTTTIPFLSMFSDCPTCARRNTNSGVILMHSNYSQVCLHEWKHLFDAGSTWAVYDQRHLRDLVTATTPPKSTSSMSSSTSTSTSLCKIYKLPDHHRLYPTWKDMRTKVSATFVHNTNSYNSLKIPNHVQTDYFEYLLQTTEFSKIEHF